MRVGAIAGTEFVRCADLTVCLDLDFLTSARTKSQLQGVGGAHAQQQPTMQIMQALAAARAQAAAAMQNFKPPGWS